MNEYEKQLQELSISKAKSMDEVELLKRQVAHANDEAAVYKVDVEALKAYIESLGHEVPDDLRNNFV